MSKTTRMISLILSIAIVLSLFPTAVLAAQETEAGNRVSVGDCILMGTKNNERISWKVLSVEENIALLHCNYVIDFLSYGPTSSYSYADAFAPWCTDFYSSGVFSEEEQNAIISTTVNGCDDQKLFLFSKSEFLTHFPNGEGGYRPLFTGVSGVDGAVGLGTVPATDDNLCYYLASTSRGSSSLDLASYVNKNYVDATSANLQNYQATYGVCPAMYVDIDQIDDSQIRQDGVIYPADKIKIGDFIVLGTFNSHPMLWQVVGNTDGKLKIFCTDILFNGSIDADINMHGNASVMEGETNWHTSDIRRYLNSNNSTVSYKGKIPNYGSLPGFLTNFTSEELALIQDTTHKSLVHYSTSGVEVDGGSNFAQDTFFDRTEFDVDAYNELAYVNVTERVFLPDMMDLREVEDAGLSYYRCYYYNEYSDSFIRGENSGFFTRTPVYSIIRALTTTYYFGVYYLETHLGATLAEADYGIRPMCYIQLEPTQTLSGDGTLESPYALSDETGSTDDGIQVISRSPENDGTLGDNQVVSMTFNHEVEAVNTGLTHGNFSIVRQIEEADSRKFETVYSLSEGDHIDTDVTISGITVTIDISSAELVLGETYYVLMDTGVITFKDTSKTIGFGGMEWTFTYSPSESLSGFTLGKHNNSFSNSNAWENSGFEGITKHTLSLELYEKLLQSASLSAKIKITLLLTIGDWNGSCQGIASTMLLAYKNKLDLSQIEDSVSFYYDMPRPCENEQFLNIIEYFQLAQDVIHNEHADNSEISEFLPILLTKLNTNPVVFSYKAGNTAHAILALDYTQDENGDYLVYLYDMNSWGSNTHGKLTLLQIANDFSDCFLTKPDGVILRKNDFSLVQFSTIADLNAINPYAESSVQSADESSYRLNQDIAKTVLIEVPMSEPSFVLENAAGETLVLDKTGQFSGTMEILDMGMFVSEDIAGNDSSRWELTVAYSDSFSFAADESGVDITFFTGDSCLGLVSDDVHNAKFIMDEGVVIEAPTAQDEYEFSSFLSHDMIEGNNVRIINASATAIGQATISITGAHITMTAETITGKDLTLIDGLTKKKLSDLNDADDIIELPKESEEDDNGNSSITPVIPQPIASAKHEESVNPFTDVSTDDYFSDAVIWASEEGITTGTSAVSFSPDASCTRAQAVTFLWRAVGSPAPRSTEMPFADVPTGAYYYDAVLWAVENGITTGTGDTTFSPNATCTRGQIVTFLWRTRNAPAVTAANPFADVAEDAYYRQAVLWAVKESVTTGTFATTFSPDADCTRAQIVTFLYRTFAK